MVEISEPDDPIGGEALAWDDDIGDEDESWDDAPAESKSDRNQWPDEPEEVDEAEDSA